jgi:uroporphyrinogen decarboxylase
VNLTSQQRVARTFAGEDVDRVPRFDTYWRETVERWQAEGLAGDADRALELLGSDLRMLGVSLPIPFPGRQRVLSEDADTRVSEDEWGTTIREWKARTGTPEHLGWGCTTPEIWQHTYKPLYQALASTIDMADVRRRYQAGRQAKQWCFLATAETFEATRRLIGDEGTLMAILENPEWIRDVSQTFTDAVLRGLEAVLATGIVPDGLFVYGDMAYNHSTVCSPAIYRELIWPDHKRLADWAHQHGMKFIYHTDGDFHGVIDLYIEAGFDCVQPLEAKAQMDVRQLAPRYGSQLCLFGNIDAMVLSTNDRDRIAAEVRSKLTAGKSCRRYIYHSDHSVPPQVSWATYQYLIELLDQYGRYKE